MQTTLRKLTAAWPLVIFLLLPAFARAETAVQAWVQRYNGPGNANDQARAVAADGSNNVIVTGASATTKYSSAGVSLWTNLYSGGSAYALAIDSNDDVSVTGSPATIKYTNGGLPLWTNLFAGGTAYAIAVDHSNNVIVTGAASGNYATIKYSPAGQPLWTNRYNGPGNGTDRACALAVDGSNNVIVTGYVYVRAGFPLDDYDYATIKYSSAGLPLWTNRYTRASSSDDEACALAVDGNNDVIVTGSADNFSTIDYATIKYSSAGLPLWTNRYNQPGNYANNPAAMAVDGSNDVIVTGASGVNTTTNDYATVKYSSTGAPLWTNRYNGPPNGDDQATAMTIDRSGNIIITGYSMGTGSGYDFATIKYICVPEPVMTCLQPTNSNYQLRVDSVLQPGTLVIEASTNLADLAAWAPIFTNTTPTNVFFYTDPAAGNNGPRFYRAFQFP